MRPPHSFGGSVRKQGTSAVISCSPGPSTTIDITARWPRAWFARCSIDLIVGLDGAHRLHRATHCYVSCCYRTGPAFRSRWATPQERGREAFDRLHEMQSVRFAAIQAAELADLISMRHAPAELSDHLN